jgi:hypothetical protein
MLWFNSASKEYNYLAGSASKRREQRQNFWPRSKSRDNNVAGVTKGSKPTPITLLFVTKGFQAHAKDSESRRVKADGCISIELSMSPH